MQFPLPPESETERRHCKNIQCKQQSQNWRNIIKFSVVWPGISPIGSLWLSVRCIMPLRTWITNNYNTTQFGTQNLIEWTIAANHAQSWTTKMVFEQENLRCSGKLISAMKVRRRNERWYKQNPSAEGLIHNTPIGHKNNNIIYVIETQTVICRSSW